MWMAMGWSSGPLPTPARWRTMAYCGQGKLGSRGLGVSSSPPTPCTDDCLPHRSAFRWSVEQAPQWHDPCRTTFTAVGHTITSVIGAGILNLPFAVSVLGWVAGPVCLLIFSLITQYTSQLLADCGVIRGVRQRTYTDVVETTFGRCGYIIIGW